MEAIEEALNALVSDTDLRFSLDDRRVYMTGFSGGARVAVAAAAAMKGKVAGVIGCGAGFHSEIPPSAARSFAYFGAIGTEDFNFPEMRALDDTLEKLGTAHRLEIFNGDHEWPPEAICTRALEWLEVQAVRSGLRNSDPAWIDEVYSRAVAEARDCERKQESYEAFQRYLAVARDFAGLKDTSPVKSKAMELQKSKDVAKAFRQEKQIIETQERLVAEISGALDDVVAGKNRPFRTQDLSRRFAGLREQVAQTRNEVDRLPAARVLSLFWVRLSEDASLDIQNKKYGNAAFRLEMMGQIRPDNPRIFYRLSRIHAVAGNKKDALRALRNAIAKGFKDSADLETNPDFSTIRTDPAFLDILGTIKK